MQTSRFSVVETRPAEQWRTNGAVERITRVVPDEAAIGINFDSRPHVVLMATPADVLDLALGFTVTEGIGRLDQIDEMRVSECPEGIVVDLLLTPGAREALNASRRRSLEGRSSCGLCGVQHLADAARRLPRAEASLVVSREAIQTALRNLESEQAHGAVTRAMHAAAWADRDGRLLHVREDVGRHNALDKVIGAAYRRGRPPGEAFIVVTSRCSYEMVDKTAMAGVPMLVAISAPTSLAIRKAEEAGITLVALAREDGHAVFARPGRIFDESAPTRIAQGDPPYQAPPPATPAPSSEVGPSVDASEGGQDAVETA
jgi:FdhD protein